MTKATDDIAIAARKVSGLAATSWDDLVAAFRAFSNEKDKDLREAPTDRLAVLQGAAQNAAQILKMLEDCRAIAEKVENLKNGRTT